MKKYWRALGLSILVALLIFLRTSLTVSAGSDRIMQISSQGVFLLAQANSSDESIAAPESPNKSPSEKNEKNFPVTLDGETLFSFSSVIEGIPAKNRADETGSYFLFTVNSRWRH